MAFLFLSCYFSVLTWPIYSCVIVYLYAWLPFCFISFWDKIVLLVSNHTSILRKVICPPSLSSAHFMTAEVWRWFRWLHHLGKHQATFMKSNQGNRRLMAGLVSGIAHWACELKYQEMSVKTTTWTCMIWSNGCFYLEQNRILKAPIFCFLGKYWWFFDRTVLLGLNTVFQKAFTSKFQFHALDEHMFMVMELF